MNFIETRASTKTYIKVTPILHFFTVYESSQPDYRILNVVFRCYSRSLVDSTVDDFKLFMVKEK